jgi:hypothetical protein
LSPQRGVENPTGMTCNLLKTGGEGGFEPPVDFKGLRRFSNANAVVMLYVAL